MTQRATAIKGVLEFLRGMNLESAFDFAPRADDVDGTARIALLEGFVPKDFTVSLIMASTSSCVVRYFACENAHRSGMRPQ